MSHIELGKAESQLRGTTLRVYWLLFKSGKGVGVREIQRAIGLASPSTALYHLEKLKDLGLARKNEFGHYEVADEVKVGVVRLFLRVGRIVLPRYLFYGVFFLVALVAYLAQAGLTGSPVNLMAVMFGLTANAVAWYEVARLWKERML